MPSLKIPGSATGRRFLSRANISYAAARLLNMAVRPVSLSATAYFFGKGPAENLSLIIFAVAIGMMFMAIDPYRAYYKKIFNALPSGQDFALYIIIISVWGALVSLTMAGVLLSQHVPPIICILSVAMFIGEKIADEQLRFRLFERDLDSWSNLVIRRSVLQLGGLAVCAVMYGRGYSFTLFLLTFCLSWVAAFSEPIYRTGRIILTRLPIFTSRKFLRGAALRFSASASLMMSSFISSAPTYFDRVITIIVDKSSLPLFLIASMSFSIITSFVDFFFLSKIRLNLLKNDIHIRDILLSRAMWLCILCGVVAGIVIIAIEKYLLGHIYAFDYTVLALIAAINITLSVTSIPQQIVYWRDGPRGIFTVELPFLAAIACPFLLRWNRSWTLAEALTVVALGLLGRFVLYLVRSHGRSFAVAQSLDGDGAAVGEGVSPS